jgi:hypothetical protein
VQIRADDLPDDACIIEDQRATISERRREFRCTVRSVPYRENKAHAEVWLFEGAPPLDSTAAASLRDPSSSAVKTWMRKALALAVCRRAKVAPGPIAIHPQARPNFINTESDSS